jgi:hypothetical protein
LSNFNWKRPSQEEEEGLQAPKPKKKKRGYTVCSSGYAATDTS